MRDLFIYKVWRTDSMDSYEWYKAYVKRHPEIEEAQKRYGVIARQRRAEGDPRLGANRYCPACQRYSFAMICCRHDEQTEDDMVRHSLADIEAMIEPLREICYTCRATDVA